MNDSENLLPPYYEPEHLVVKGARVHNLKDIDVIIPRNRLVVLTGISGSGKSSLAFDTIYAEGQRRYMETFSTYVRQFIGKMERPDVESIDGLSPVISIEQKTTGWNPRSTVGTVTELYDFLRLLYARAGEAYSPESGEKMISYTEQEIIDLVLGQFQDKAILILAPLVKGRKGHYRELFEQMRKLGYAKVRIDGEMEDIKPGMQIDRYKTHDIELLIDQIRVEPAKEDRLIQSLRTGIKMGEGSIQILEHDSRLMHFFSKNLVDPASGLAFEEPNPNTFSFNTPYGACPACAGLGTVHTVNMEKVIPDSKKNINEGGIVPLGEARENLIFTQLRALAAKFKFSFSTPIEEIPDAAMKIILYGKADEAGITVPYANTDYSYNLVQDGLIRMLTRWFEDSSSERIRSWAEEFMILAPCPECGGARLKKEALCFKLGEKNISELAQMDLDTLALWIEQLPAKLNAKQNRIAQDVLKEIHLRLGFLLDVGLNYLTLDRQARTLSGGESQRTRLANQIGSQLSGITYIMDEPSIGLHQRDNQRLIQSLKQLVAVGNTVLVVEHDKDIMLASDYLIDLGPGAGKNGGNIMASGHPDSFKKASGITAEFLANQRNIDLPDRRRPGNGQKLTLKGASGNNLNKVDLEIPLGTFTCITGVSGSGKSTLINDTLYPALRKYFYKSLQNPLPYESLEGLEHLDKVVEIDQSPIGRTPRSNPATYTNLFNDIRKIFAELPEAKIRGYKPGRFSFNVKGGRCETCEGAGLRVIEMNFLPDVQVHCETCHGKRYNRETLEVLYKGKSISDVLDMTVEEAEPFFENIPSIYRKVKTLREVGLGYITLGQQATTLSGGEAQRVKLAEELSKKDTGKTIYILDEPTTGLHFEDIRFLLLVLQRLVEKGNTVIVIEHNLDMVKVSDYIVDLGPEGGRGGGNILATGTPEAIMTCADSFTGQYLIKELEICGQKPLEESPTPLVKSKTKKRNSL
jgi:excinuclease ABC subunit A